MGFLPIYVYVIAISFLVSLSVYVKPVPSFFYLNLFPPFLFVTIIAEIVGSYLGYIGKNNLILYNFFTVTEFCFYLSLISIIIKGRQIKKIIWIVTGLYFITAVANIYFFQGMERFHTITYSLGCLLIVVFCIFYFFELFRLPQTIKLSLNPAFWICTGLLFFYCCGFPLYAFIHLWSRLKWAVKSFDSVVMILNIFLYSLFTISFLCTKTLKSTL